MVDGSCLMVRNPMVDGWYQTTWKGQVVIHSSPGNLGLWSWGSHCWKQDRLVDGTYGTQWQSIKLKAQKFGSLSIWHGTCHKDPSKVDLRQSDITLDQASLGHFSWVQCSGSLPNPSLIVNQENSVSGFWIIWHAKSSTSGGFFSEWFEYIWPTSTQLQHNQKDGDTKLIMIIIITC